MVGMDRGGAGDLVWSVCRVPCQQDGRRNADRHSRYRPARILGIIDHFGWIGFDAHRASPFRILGCELMVAGLALIAKF